MPRAVLKNGQVELVDAIPPHWRDGLSLRVDADQYVPKQIDIEARLAEFDELSKGDDSSTDEELSSAIHEIRQLAKEQIKREMGLP